MPVEHLAAGGRRIKVTIDRVKRKLALRFRRPCDDASRALLAEVKAMRGAEWDKENTRWLVTNCRRNQMQIDAMAGRPVPEFSLHAQPRTGTPRRGNLKEHQIPMFQFLWTVRQCILAAEMGTMKTLPTIEVMEQAGGEWWYVSTPKVLTSIKLEFRKWKARVQPKWVSFNSLHATLERHKGAAPRGVVLDEASFLKGKGPWYDAAQHLADGVREDHGLGGFVLLLTGTPSPKDPTDWHSLAEIACPGLLRESTKPRLTERLAILKKVTLEGGRQFMDVVGWKKDEVAKLGRRLQPITHVVYAKDCQSLPEMREELIHLEPNPDTIRAAQMVAENSVGAAEALGKVRQLSDGFQYQKDGPALRCDTPKDEALREFLDRNEAHGRCIIYAPYRESIDRVVEICGVQGWDVLRCDGRGWETTAFDVETALLSLDRTQDPGTVRKIAFVGHPRSGGFGLNLTACREGLYYSCDFDWGSHAQSKKRPHRHGMDENKGFTWYFLCHLPTDAYVLQNHANKRELSSITLDEILKVLRGKESVQPVPRVRARSSGVLRRAPLRG